MFWLLAYNVNTVHFLATIAHPLHLASLALKKRSPQAFLQMQAEGEEMHGGGQAQDVVQATKRSCATLREPGSVICTEPNTP